MPRDIFTDVTRPPAGLGSQAWYTVPASIFTHAAIVAILVIIPLVVNDVVPLPSPDMIVMAAPPMPEPPPAPVDRPVRSAPQPAAPSNRAAAPISAPDKIVEELTGPPAPPDVRAAEEGIGRVPGVIGAISGKVGIPDPPTAREVKPVPVGGKVKYPEKVRDVRPVYPPIAVASRVEGMVIIEAILGVDGRVQDARVLRSIPLLDRAALDAVQQWQFTPTLLNGVPVPVVITVTVNFKLQ